MTRSDSRAVNEQLLEMGYSQDEIDGLDFATIDAILNGDHC